MFVVKYDVRNVGATGGMDRVGDTEIPAPPWRKPRKATPVRRTLSRELIVATALRVLDAEGLDAVSMRRVAQELDTGPASLYAHVANKDELLEAVLDRVMAEIVVPQPDPPRWREQIRQTATESHRVLAAHADIARVALVGIPTGPHSLRVAEGMFAILLAGGVPPGPASWALDRIALYISGDAYEGSLHLARQRASGKSVEQYMADYFGQMQAFYASLPPDRFPTITKHLDALMAGDGEARFEFGLDLLIDGVATYAVDGANPG